MSSEPARRCIWPTTQQVRLLRVLAADYADIAELVEQIDAAPADPVEAATDGLLAHKNEGHRIRIGPQHIRGDVDAVLRALGWDAS